MAAFLLLAGAVHLLPGQERADRFFDSNGVSIRFIEQGTGDPVVLIHGFGGSADDPWVKAGILQALAVNHRVIAIDCRGFGRSGKPAGVGRYGVEMALDVVRLLDHLGIPRAHVVGYSMGAAVAAKLVTLRPERFATVVLGGYGARLSWLAADPASRQNDARYEQRAVELEGGPGGRTDPGTIARAAALRSFREQRVAAAEMAALTVPALSIVGKKDEGLADVLELKRVMPGLKLVLIEGADHDSTRRTPEFLRTLAEFLRAHPISP
ncbi:MAG: hypothetical protein RIR76_1880 [Verrucomicrobiota bacterium]|jgi:pimeloyl-ACP methyl ester carboxylesterase